MARMKDKLEAAEAIIKRVEVATAKLQAILDCRQKGQVSLGGYSQGYTDGVAAALEILEEPE